MAIPACVYYAGMEDVMDPETDIRSFNTVLFLIFLVGTVISGLTLTRILIYGGIVLFFNGLHAIEVRETRKP